MVENRAEMRSVPDPAVLVVFGATGDLAHRKLYPALASLAQRHQLPARFAVVGVARTVDDEDDFASDVRAAVAKAGDGDEPGRGDALDRAGVVFRYVSGSFDDEETFAKLARVLAQLDASHGTGGNYLFYLSTIPQMFGTIADQLGRAGLATEPPGCFRRLVVEKPFGHDTASAEELNAKLHATFGEHQVFRIDHYLAKETVRNILALRFTNTIFEPLWNRRYVDHVQITVAESLGVEHRGTFYERAGALRDIVQNHLLQVFAFIAMEAPASFQADAVRDEKVKALRAVRPLDPADLRRLAVRGQYAPGRIDGVEVPGYREEHGVSPSSLTETFLALQLDVDNWRWAGVPFFLRTGKRLPRRVTEVALRFKPVPFLPLPRDAVESLEPNCMILRIQPDEGLALQFAAKVPGQGFHVRTVDLAFDYATGFAEHAPQAYERVLHEALLGDATLFIREDEVAVSWRIVQPLVDAFEDGRIPLALYPAGRWGPIEAHDLIAGTGDRWREP